MTEALARMVANSAGDSVVGGGDTIAAIQRLKIENEFSFTSTAGGAMLDFLAHGTLPGIEALEKSRKIN
jgi:3-phosphoglycerate kinase